MATTSDDTYLKAKRYPVTESFDSEQQAIIDIDPEGRNQSEITRALWVTHAKAIGMPLVDNITKHGHRRNPKK